MIWPIKCRREKSIAGPLAAGVHINASCGGEWGCGKCRIILESGEVDYARSGLLSDDDWALGYILPYRTVIIGPPRIAEMI